MADAWPLEGGAARIFEGAASCGERLILRLHGPTAGPMVVYLPGLHGDWTLVGGLRAALGSEVGFAEFTYPRTVAWTLSEYARAIEGVLETAGVGSGWVLAESFGSQIAWDLCGRATRFAPRGLILAGGFGRYPIPWALRLGTEVGRRFPLKWFRAALRAYAILSRWRLGGAPERVADLAEFVGRRTEEDRRAAVHRLGLIAGNDPAALAGELRLPVYYLTGFLDPIVPWPWIPGWLRRHCPGFRAWRMVWASDHTVLGSGRRAAARAILDWVKRSPEVREGVCE